MYNFSASTKAHKRSPRATSSTSKSTIWTKPWRDQGERWYAGRTTFYGRRDWRHDRVDSDTLHRWVLRHRSREGCGYFLACTFTAIQRDFLWREHALSCMPGMSTLQVVSASGWSASAAPRSLRRGIDVIFHRRDGNPKILSRDIHFADLTCASVRS